jgi:hypothetical protein
MPDPQFQKAQHSVLIANLNRQGYREVKLHVILVGEMGNIYKDYTDKPLADLNLDYHKLKTSHKMNEHSIRHASALIKTKVCTAIQHKQQQSSFGSGCHGTQPP